MSHDPIENLFERWQANPDTPETVELCEALRTARRPDLVEIVGTHASQQLDIVALMAAARMYTDTNLLEEAQAVLLSAGRIAPRDGEVYRWLGDVLLRRGDAERAEKVLEKAIQFGAEGYADTLIERARALVPVQKSGGPDLVAEAVRESNRRVATARAQQATRTDSQRKLQESQRRLEESQRKLDDSDRRVELRRRVEQKRLVPVDNDEEVETKIRDGESLRGAIEAALSPIGSPDIPAMTPPPPSVRPPPLHAPPRSNPPPPMELPKGGAVFASGGHLGHMPEPNDLIFTTPTRAGFEPEPLPPPSARAQTAAFEDRDPRPSPRYGNDAQSAMPLRAAAAAQSPRGLRAAEPPVNPMMLEALARPPQQVGGASVPEARDVLEALQIAGVYEPDGAVAPVGGWAQPEKVKRFFSTVTLISLAVCLVGGGFGTYFYITNKRAKEHVQAEGILANVDKDLHLGDARKMEAAEKAIAQSFELESRSPHAALTWLHERVLIGLVKGGADIAFEDSIQRAKAVGVEDKKTAFAHVASFLFQGDTAGAAATVAKYDQLAHDDPWFQLIAGATFERAGDTRALERYGASVKLDPELVIAQILFIRATAVDGDPRRAAELAKDFRTRHPERIEGAALIVLAWTRDAFHREPPAELKEVLEKTDPLPVSLRTVPHAARALEALHKGAVDEARPSLQKGLDVADTPGVAAWLGSIALLMGDENLARKAALAAVSFSAVYPPARVLAARVALLGARLDEALKATEDLPPASPDVAVVTAAASYEKLDGERIARAFDAIPEEARKLPFALPLARGQALLAGNLGILNTAQAIDMSDDEAPWADLVAMDWALDAGEAETARKIAEQWRGEPRAMRALRLARLHRYEMKLEEADKFSKMALESGTVTVRVLIERVFTLVAMKKDTEALALFKQYPNIGGSLSKWLKAYATAAHGKTEEARAMVAQEEPPGPSAPMPARMLAASAYAMMKDVRHGGEYTKPITQAGFANPDMIFAAEKLALVKPGRRR